MGSIILGVIGAFFVLCSLVPFMGIINVISIPLLIIGLILGITGICKKEKAKKGLPIAGTVICGLFLLLALSRISGGTSMTRSLVNATSKKASQSAIKQMKSAVDNINQFVNDLDEISNPLDELSNR